MKIEENASLRRITSWHVGGPARFLVTTTTDDEVRAALQLAEDRQLPFFILGKGSNTLFPDEGFPGVIIQMADRTLTCQDTTITASSGVFMRQLINFAHDNNLHGLEDLAGIPGTVGGAVRGNAGTWQTEIKDYLTQIETLVFDVDRKQWHHRTLLAAKCEFGYRHSIFKEQPLWIILRAAFALHAGKPAAASDRVAWDAAQRHKKQPYDAPSAGSVFKNPAASEGIYAGKLIEEAGLKGLEIGGAQVSPKHANFILNRNHATSTDIRQLITTIQTAVLAKHGIRLEPEIVIIPPLTPVTAS